MIQPWMQNHYFNARSIQDKAESLGFRYIIVELHPELIDVRVPTEATHDMVFALSRYINDQKPSAVKLKVDTWPYR